MSGSSTQDEKGEKRGGYSDPEIVFLSSTA